MSLIEEARRKLAQEMSLQNDPSLQSSKLPALAAGNEVPSLEVDSSLMKRDDMKAGVKSGHATLPDQMNYIAKSPQVASTANSTQQDGSQQRQDRVPFSPRPASRVPAIAQNESKDNGYKVTDYPPGVANDWAPAGTRASVSSTSRRPVATSPLVTAAIDASAVIGSPPTMQGTPVEHASALERDRAPVASKVSLPPKRYPAPTRVSVPSKRPSAVEEVTKMLLPNGFLQTETSAACSGKRDGAEAADDAYSKLAALWSERGGEDASGIFETWTNPDGGSAWNQIKLPFPRVPDAIPPRGTPVQSSDESDVPSPQPQTGVSVRRTPSRRKVHSVATDVYVDTRHVGVVTKKAKVMKQSPKTTDIVGPLDRANFRDYRLLPADYFVASVDFLKAKAEAEKARAEREENASADGSPNGRRPRRRRKPRELGETSTPQRDPGWKERPPKTSVRVGRKYQAFIPPRLLAQTYKPDFSYVPRSDQVWDPQRAAEAIEAGEDIDGFLAHAIDLNSRLLLMESLHRGGYSVKRAIGEFVTMFRRCDEPTSQLYLEEIIKATDMFGTCRKEFHRISNEVGRSVSSVLVQYYQWKGRDTDGAYSKLKRESKAEGDYCDVCEDGGILIVCDLCHKAYHLECLVPPLKQMPKASEWYCSHCLKSPAKLRRIPSMSLASSTHGCGTFSDSKPPAMRALPFPAERATLDFGNEREHEPSAFTRNVVGANSQSLPNQSNQVLGGSFAKATPTKTTAKSGEDFIDLTLT